MLRGPPELIDIFIEVTTFFATYLLSLGKETGTTPTAFIFNPLQQKRLFCFIS